MRVLLSVVHFAETRVALVIEYAVAQLIGSEELPHLFIGPMEYWEDANELGPAFAAWADVVKVLRIRICPTIAHYYCLDSFLVYQPRDLCFEVRGVELDLYSIPTQKHPVNYSISIGHLTFSQLLLETS